jgi:catechol 2,3-dioxygenase-like lactoylglutathione lyase family enzyme
MSRPFVAGSLVGVCLLLPAMLRAANPQVGAAPEPPKTAAGPRPFIVALSVTDIEASTKWYVDTLGFRVRYPATGHTKPLRTLLELGGFFLSLISVDHPAERNSVLPNPLDPASLTGVYRFGVEVPDVDVVLKPLRQKARSSGLRWTAGGASDGANSRIQMGTESGLSKS